VKEFEKLGSLKKIYRNKKTPIYSVILICLILFFFIFFLFIFIYEIFGKLRTHGLLILIQIETAKLLMPTCGIIISSLLLLLLFQKARYFIAQFQNGLIIHQDKNHLIINWGDIFGVSTRNYYYKIFGLIPINIVSCMLNIKNKKAITLNSSIENCPDLLTEIKSIIYPRLTPILKKLFSAGNSINFGSMSINNNYFSYNDNQYSWNSVITVNISSGILVIELDNNKKIKIPIENIYNLEIMLDLIKSITKNSQNKIPDK